MLHNLHYQYRPVSPSLCPPDVRFVAYAKHAVKRRYVDLKWATRFSNAIDLKSVCWSIDILQAVYIDDGRYRYDDVC